MLASPRPVDPAAPTVLSQYWPAPTIGESPMRPGTFHESPLVVVTDDMSPPAFTAFMLIVPVVNFTCSGSSIDRLDVSGGGALSSQASAGLRHALQRSQSRLLFSVRRFCSLNPISIANRLAPSPTSMMWSVWSITAFATREGVAMPSSAATAPARLVGPCMQDASS